MSGCPRQYDAVSSVRGPEANEVAWKLDRQFFVETAPAEVQGYRALGGTRRHVASLSFGANRCRRL